MIGRLITIFSDSDCKRYRCFLQNTVPQHIPQFLILYLPDIKVEVLFSAGRDKSICVILGYNKVVDIAFINEIMINSRHCVDIFRGWNGFEIILFWKCRKLNFHQWLIRRKISDLT